MDKVQLGKITTQTENRQTFSSSERKLSIRGLIAYGCSQGMIMGGLAGWLESCRPGVSWQTAAGLGVRLSILFMIVLTTMNIHFNTCKMPPRVELSKSYLKERLAKLFRPSPTLWIWLVSIPSAILLDCILQNLDFPKF